jgi:hypothetical protein
MSEEKNLSDERILKQLELLLDFTTPESIKKSTTEIFMRYLMDNHSVLPQDFETIVSDVYYLLRFIDSIGRKNTNE